MLHKQSNRVACKARQFSAFLFASVLMSCSSAAVCKQPFIWWFIMQTPLQTADLHQSDWRGQERRCSVSLWSPLIKVSIWHSSSLFITETTPDWFAHQLEAANQHGEHFVCFRSFSEFTSSCLVLMHICSPQMTCELCSETWSTAAAGRPGCSLSCTGPVRDKRSLKILILMKFFKTFWWKSEY